MSFKNLFKTFDFFSLRINIKSILVSQLSLGCHLLTNKKQIMSLKDKTKQHSTIQQNTTQYNTIHNKIQPKKHEYELTIDNSIT